MNILFFMGSIKNLRVAKQNYSIVFFSCTILELESHATRSVKVVLEGFKRKTIVRKEKNVRPISMKRRSGLC
jgi:hypothetical protein